MTAAPAGARVGLRFGLLAPLHEVLKHDHLLSDAEVSAALAAALLPVSAAPGDADLTSGRRLPGLYRLLAHPEMGVRSLVCLTWAA